MRKRVIPPAYWLAGVCLVSLLIPAPSAADVPSRALFWEVTDSSAPDAQKGTLYILGATHAGRSAIRAFDASIESAFHRSQALVVEADVRSGEEADFRRFLTERGELPPGVTLRERLTPELYAALGAALSERGIRRDAYDGYEPWLASLMLSGEALARSGYRPVFGMGRYFTERSHKPLVELEGARAQIDGLDRLPLELQTAMLAEAIEGLPGLPQRMERIGALWDAGDAGGLARLLFEEGTSTPDQQRLREHIYYDRNRGMADRLSDALHSGQSWFVVVGAGHVVGPRGIPALLEERGLEVRQLSELPDLPAQRAP